MSLVTNAVGSGSSGDSKVLVYNSLVNKKVPYAFVKSDGATGALSIGPFSGITTQGKANSKQFAYIRLGPVNLSEIGSVVAEVSAPGGNTVKNRAVLFVSELPEDQSYNSTARAAIQYETGPQIRALLEVNTEDLSGMFYVYAGTDSNGGTWSGARRSIIYGVHLIKQT